MSTLHTVNKTAANDALEACLRVASNGDSLLLIEDGVYQASQLVQHPLASTLQLYALEEDIAARGLSLPATITPIGYAQFVELVCQHQRSVSWF
jgi:tRNA 2-thiouridine synthesizing protein B